MDQTITINVSWHRPGHPCDAFVTIAADDGQHRWLADTTFGPFDDEIDVARWARRQVSRALESGKE